MNLLSLFDFFNPFKAEKGPPPLAGPWDFYIECCGAPVPASWLCQGFAALGVPRSGKTSLIEGVLRECVRRGIPVISVDFEGNQDHRLREVAPPGYVVDRIDVSVEGGSAPDPMPMLRTQTARVRAAQTISPHEGHQNDFFNDAAAEVILAALSQCDAWGGHYDWADIVRLADDRYLLSSLGKELREIGDPWALFSSRKGSGADVAATLRVKLRPWMIYAALALHAPRKVDIPALARGELQGAAVLVFKDTNKHALEKLLAFVLDSFAYEKLSTTGDSFACANFDEITSLHRLESLVDIVRRGAKRRLIYTLSAQSVEGLYKRFGQEDGEDVASLPAVKAILKLQSKKSATWASDMLGVCEILDNIAPRPYMRGPNENDRIEGGIRDRANAHWDEIRRLDLASWQRDELVGFVDTSLYTRPFRCKFRHLVSTATPPPDHVPVNPGLEVLPPFTAEDFERLKFPAAALIRAEKARRRAENPRRRQQP